MSYKEDANRQRKEQIAQQKKQEEAIRNQTKVLEDANRQRKEQIAQQKKQEEAIRNQTKVLEASNRIEANRADVEKQRLKIEKQRLLADEAEWQMRRQQAEQVRQLRNLMVDSMETLELVKKSLAVESVDEATKEIALRKTAALQTQLKILESQSDILTEMSDMKELRVLRSNLSEFITEQSPTGNLPDNPLAIITERLESLNAFFTQSVKELNRLLFWKVDWLNQFPKVSLVELHQVKTELTEIKNHLPSIQERLRSMLNSLDWWISGGTPELHQELRICGELVPRVEVEEFDESAGGIILPDRQKSYNSFLPESEACADIYEFAHSTGALHVQVIDQLSKVDKRIEELICLHDKHRALLVEAESHLANENFRSAESVIEIYDKQRFPDIEYKEVDSQLQRQLAVLKKFADLDAEVNASNFRGSRENLRNLNGINVKPGSELEAAILILKKTIDQSIVLHEKARKESLTKKLVGILLVVVAIAPIIAYAIQAEKKHIVATESVEVKAAEVNAKVEHEAAEQGDVKVLHRLKQEENMSGEVPATDPASKVQGGEPPKEATTLSFGIGSGRQPVPNYPLQARLNNQEGTVVVEFIVGADGRVSSAWLQTPCQYDALNNAAISTVRYRWVFPAGEPRRYRIPIVFTLH